MYYPLALSTALSADRLESASCDICGLNEPQSPKCLGDVEMLIGFQKENSDQLQFLNGKDRYFRHVVY